MRTRNGRSRNVGAAAAAAALAVLLTSTPLAAQEPAADREHVVRRGDTLWDIARAYFNNPWLWPSIYEANRSIIRDPHWIYPDQRFVIPGDPRPRRSILLGIPIEEYDAQREPVFVEAEAEPLVLLTERAPEPVVRAAEYRTAPWIADTVGLARVGRIVRLADPAHRGDRLANRLRPFDRVHIGSLRSVPGVGDTLLVARIGRSFARLGHLVEPLGVLRVDRIEAGVAVATLIRQYGEAQIGDVVTRLEPTPELPIGPPVPVDVDVAGAIIDFLGRHTLYGATEYGFVNVGRANGLAIGDELAVFVPGRPQTRGREGIPAEEIARVRVIRVEDRTATVRVLGVNSTTLVPGLPVRLVRTAS